MSRILEALRRIEVKQCEDAPVRPDAEGSGQKPAKPQGALLDLLPPTALCSRNRGTSAAAKRTTRHPPPATRHPPPATYCSPPTDDVESDPRFSPLAEHLLKRFPPDRHAVLMLTSPGPEEGQTGVAAGLAEALAARVPGEVLAADGATQTSEISRIEELRCHYRFVVIDGPCLAHPGATTMAACCDGVFLVIELGHTGVRSPAGRERPPARRGQRARQRGGRRVAVLTVQRARAAREKRRRQAGRADSPPTNSAGFRAAGPPRKRD